MRSWLNGYYAEYYFERMIIMNCLEKHNFKFDVCYDREKCREYTLEYYLTQDEYMTMENAVRLGIDFCDVTELHDLYSYLCDLAVDIIENDIKNHRRYWQEEYESLAGNIICSDSKTQNKLTESLQEQAIRNVAKNLFSEIRY